ncbi:MAG: DnaK suppressor protein [Campylobacterota bacterium]|nr:DnaK suppressor protein [Campylobacterota bacterium]MDQ1338317.1 DnaK suppressor protein [Campylobacterota bacterium]
MKKIELEEFKTQLTAMKRSLEANIAGLKGELELVTTDEGINDMEDLASLERESMHDNTLLVQQQHELSEVLHALSKIDKGTYGICEESGDVIPLERLRAMPHARHCVKDAKKLGL